MSDLGTAYVQIVPSAQGISGKISSAISPEATAAGKTAGVKVSKSLGSTLQSVGGGMMKAGAIATAVSVPIIKGIKSAMSAYQVQSAAETKLTEIYKTRMGASKKAAESTMELASALQEQGVVGDEVALSGAQQLATFAKYPSTVEKLMPAMENLLVQQNGLDVSAESATNTANLMGKVLMGQTGALRRVGVTFDEAQEKVLKYGTEEERAAMLSKVITQNVGNMNAAMLKTPEGKIQQMKNSMGDLAEEVGGILAPALASCAQWISANVVPALQNLVDKAKEHPIIGKIGVALAGITAIGGPILMVLGGIVSGIGKVISLGGGGAGAVGKLGSAFRILSGPIGIAVTAFTILMTKSQSFRSAVSGLGQTIMASLKTAFEQLKPILTTLGGAFNQLVQVIGSALSPILRAVTPIVQQIIGIATRIISAVLPILTAAIKKIIPVIQAVLTVVTAVVKKICSVVSRLFTALAPVVKAVWGKIKTFIIQPITAIASKISSFVANVRAKFGNFGPIPGIVTGIFTRVKNAILKPIEWAKEKVHGIIEKIKGFFSFSISAPNIPLPHFSISPAGWKLKDLLKGSIPHLSISWYAKGGIVDGAQLIGAGEAGPEAIVPLDSFWNRMDAMQNQIASIQTSGSNKGSGQITAIIQLDGETIGQSTVDYINGQTIRFGINPLAV